MALQHASEATRSSGSGAQVDGQAGDCDDVQVLDLPQSKRGSLCSSIDVIALDCPRDGLDCPSDRSRSPCHVSEAVSEQHSGRHRSSSTSKAVGSSRSRHGSKSMLHVDDFGGDLNGKGTHELAMRVADAVAERLLDMLPRLLEKQSESIYKSIQSFERSVGRVGSKSEEHTPSAATMRSRRTINEFSGMAESAPATTSVSSPTSVATPRAHGSASGRQGARLSFSDMDAIHMNSILGARGLSVPARRPSNGAIVPLPPAFHPAVPEPAQAPVMEPTLDSANQEDRGNQVVATDAKDEEEEEVEENGLSSCVSSSSRNSSKNENDSFGELSDEDVPRSSPSLSHSGFSMGPNVRRTQTSYSIKDLRQWQERNILNELEEYTSRRNSTTSSQLVARRTSQTSSTCIPAQRMRSPAEFGERKSEGSVMTRESKRDKLTSPARSFRTSQASERKRTSTDSSPIPKTSKSLERLDSLRHGQEMAILADKFVLQDDLESVQTSLPATDSASYRFLALVMNASGVIPWELRFTSFYLGIPILFLISSLIGIAMLTLADKIYSTWSGLAIASLGLGAMLGLAALRASGIQNLVGVHHTPLETYALANHFCAEWVTMSRTKFLQLLVAWVIAVVAHGTLSPSDIDAPCTGGIEVKFDELMPISLLAFASVSGLFMVIIYAQFHVLTCLELMLDSFCRGMFTCLEFRQCASDWNFVQAMLRNAAHTVESSFICTQTAALVALLMSAVGIWDATNNVECQGRINLGKKFLQYMPVLILALASLHLFFKAAAVTEKCTRVPSLLNSIQVSDPIDSDRQYVVHYIQNSAAGFYVKDVRLTAVMAMKTTYIFGAVGFTLMANVITK
eukprot:TRINITY_DN4314_c0_g6_i1.p1 TRINITY_DN4314_c0_g6~~TRINITY_DN4314_c0_g6_i1.p1  ORF type:complete len:853 (-),score=109.22 TRINITY_DN4314_c0_g6_i1:105-2663(-)